MTSSIYTDSTYLLDGGDASDPLSDLKLRLHALKEEVEQYHVLGDRAQGVFDQHRCDMAQLQQKEREIWYRAETKLRRDLDDVLAANRDLTERIAAQRQSEERGLRDTLGTLRAESCARVTQLEEVVRRLAGECQSCVSGVRHAQIEQDVTRLQLQEGLIEQARLRAVLYRLQHHGQPCHHHRGSNEEGCGAAEINNLINNWNNRHNTNHHHQNNDNTIRSAHDGGGNPLFMSDPVHDAEDHSDTIPCNDDTPFRGDVCRESGTCGVQDRCRRRASHTLSRRGNVRQRGQTPPTAPSPSAQKHLCRRHMTDRGGRMHRSPAAYFLPGGATDPIASTTPASHHIHALVSTVKRRNYSRPRVYYRRHGLDANYSTSPLRRRLQAIRSRGRNGSCHNNHPNKGDHKGHADLEHDMDYISHTRGNLRAHDKDDDDWKSRPRDLPQHMAHHPRARAGSTPGIPKDRVGYARVMTSPRYPHPADYDDDDAMLVPALLPHTRSTSAPRHPSCDMESCSATLHNTGMCRDGNSSSFSSRMPVRHCDPAAVCVPKPVQEQQEETPEHCVQRAEKAAWTELQVPGRNSHACCSSAELVNGCGTAAGAEPHMLQEHHHHQVCFQDVAGHTENAAAATAAAAAQTTNTTPMALPLYSDFYKAPMPASALARPPNMNCTPAVTEEGPRTVSTADSPSSMQKERDGVSTPTAAMTDHTTVSVSRVDESPCAMPRSDRRIADSTSTEHPAPCSSPVDLLPLSRSPHRDERQMSGHHHRHYRQQQQQHHTRRDQRYHDDDDDEDYCHRFEPHKLTHSQDKRSTVRYHADDDEGRDVQYGSDRVRAKSGQTRVRTQQSRARVPPRGGNDAEDASRDVSTHYSGRAMNAACHALMADVTQLRLQHKRFSDMLHDQHANCVVASRGMRTTMERVSEKLEQLHMLRAQQRRCGYELRVNDTMDDIARENRDCDNVHAELVNVLHSS